MTFYQFSLAISVVERVILLAGSLTCALLYTRLNKRNKSLAIYIILMCFCDMLSRYVGAVYKNNHIVLPIYSCIELVFFTHFYNYRLYKKPSPAYILLGIAGAAYIIWELITDFIISAEDVKQFQPYAKVADNFIVILFALHFLYQKMSVYSGSRWDNFRLNIIMLFYFTVNTIMWIPFNFLVNEESGIKFYFWSVNMVSVAAFYCYILFEIVMGVRPKRPKHIDLIG